MGNYRRDWVARKPFFVNEDKTNPGTFMVQINERKLITETPYKDLISSLEEMLVTAKHLHLEQHATNPVS